MNKIKILLVIIGIIILKILGDNTENPVRFCLLLVGFNMVMLLYYYNDIRGIVLRNKIKDTIRLDLEGWARIVCDIIGLGIFLYIDFLAVFY